MWPSRRIVDLLGIDLPIIQAPMAGANGSALASAVSEAGGLGSLPCAMLSADQARDELAAVRQRTARPVNVNFFCHRPPAPQPAREAGWKARLRGYYVELGLDPEAPASAATRRPFGEPMCELIEELKPPVVSFHFGMPDRRLVARVKGTGARVLGCATSVDEARWLEDEGCDAIVAQGFEAGGHQGVFLVDDIARQFGTIALVPQVVEAVTVPVIAAGGIGDARGIVAAFALGADAVQIGTAYLRCPEATITRIHREALARANDNASVLTNVFTGRPARGIANRLIREVGPMSDLAPDFPLAAGAVAPLRAKAEAAGSGDFSPLWTGQAGTLAREMPAADLTRLLASDALALLKRIAAG
jgi:nitronate monooxygenase